MLRTKCIPCRHEHHEKCQGIRSPSPGVMGGTSCSCDCALNRTLVCGECGTEATRVSGRRQGTSAWWCWRCEKHIRPVVAPADQPETEA